METTLAVLVILGIFVGIPAVVGLAIAGMYIMSDRRVRRANRVKALETATEALPQETADVHS
jgi:hypothetical protein